MVAVVLRYDVVSGYDERTRAVLCSELGVPTSLLPAQGRPLRELLLLFVSLSLYLLFFAVSLVFQLWLGDGGSVVSQEILGAG